jgi:DtxR family Mn-dependent transcriptional regulator
MMVNPLITLVIGLLLILFGAMLFWPKKGLFFRWQNQKILSEKVLREHIAKDIQKRSLEGDQLDIKALALLNQVDEEKIVRVISGMKNGGFIIEDGNYFKLTESGQELATRVIRAHRIYERYLADHTGFDEIEWHEKAHSYEHILSTEQVEEISKKLGHPVHDPHGDLIPTKEGEYFDTPGIILTEAPLNKALQIVSVPDEPAELASIVLGQNIVPDEIIKVTEVTGEIVQFIHDGKTHNLPVNAAKYVKVHDMVTEEESFVDCIPLSSLTPGQAAKVEHISPHVRGQERRRFMDLGILKGTVISAEFESPAGDPTAYMIRGAVIALRKEQADQIIISPQLEVE